jgi:ComF family protein
MDDCQLNTLSKLNLWLKSNLLKLGVLRCVGCQNACTNHLRLCVRCVQQLPLLLHGCRTCAKPISNGQPICGFCLNDGSIFEKVYVPFHFDEPINQWIAAFKFSADLAIGKVLIDEVVTKLKADGFDQDASVIAVPLHRKRLRERGFNQSAMIARELSRKLGLQDQSHLIRRIKDSGHQVGASKATREANVKQAFTCNGHFSASVIIVDDVMTTGATSRAVARLLKKHGVTNIYLALIARAS